MKLQITLILLSMGLSCALLAPSCSLSAHAEPNAWFILSTLEQPGGASLNGCPDASDHGLYATGQDCEEVDLDDLACVDGDA